jgi:hypothetical protein
VTQYANEIARKDNNDVLDGIRRSDKSELIGIRWPKIMPT